MIETESLVTAERVRELLNYDCDTGRFTWRVNIKGTKAGRPAGSLYGGGYIKITVDGRRYGAHRLAWLHVTGNWPTSLIDHINRDASDNRFVNLREASYGENCANRGPRKDSRTGIRGVEFRPQCPINPYRVVISKNGKRTYVGHFPTISEAVEAYNAAALKFWGSHFNPRSTPRQRRAEGYT